MKKITKILPLAMALMLAGSAFAATAETANEQSSTMVLTVPEFINITKTDSVEEANAEFNADYTTLNTSVTMNAGFHVITNVPDKKIYLKGTCQGADGVQTALYGDSAGALNLVFANEQVKPTTAAITNITGKAPAKADNANAVAFSLTPAITPDAASGAVDPNAVLADGKVTYTLKNGAYDMVYTLGQTASENTFSTHDTWGTYKATLVLTDANP